MFFDEKCKDRGGETFSPRGPSINDVTALGGRGYQGFCDNSTKNLINKKREDGGRGVKNYQKLRDVIYGQPQFRKTLFKTIPYNQLWLNYQCVLNYRRLCNFRISFCFDL
jgi:hypothetical protein